MEQIFGGLSDIFTLGNFFCIGSGILLGIFVGAVPGMNGPMALALLIPVSYYLPPLAAISFLVGITKGACYGGSISGILLNTPGSPEAACICLDGYPLAQQGKSEKALKMALFASIFGDNFSDIFLILVAAPIASIALKMGPTGICSLVIFALTLIAILSGKSLIKGLMAGVFGIFIACIGTDPLMGIPRMTLGFYQLSSGIPLTAIAIGMLVANLLNLGLGYFGLKVFSRVLLAPKAIIYPAIIFICAIGAFVEESSFFSVGIMFVCAVLGVLMKKYDFSFVTFIIGFVLGPMFEYSLQQVLSASQGNLMIFFQRPVSAVVVVLTIVFLVHNGIRNMKQRQKVKHPMALKDAAEGNHG